MKHRLILHIIGLLDEAPIYQYHLDLHVNLQELPPLFHSLSGVVAVDLYTVDTASLLFQDGVPINFYEKCSVRQAKAGNGLRLLSRPTRLVPSSKNCAYVIGYFAASGREHVS